MTRHTLARKVNSECFDLPYYSGTDLMLLFDQGNRSIAEFDEVREAQWIMLLFLAALTVAMISLYLILH